jgi:8-oxo-dGTP diphosphatase
VCIEWQGPEPDRTESVMLVYDGGILPENAEIQLPPDELASFRFLTSEELDAVTSHRISRRIRAALLAADDGRLVELEHGSLVPPLPATWP